jgi:CDP-glucose 4,6-dehydratase
LISARAGNIIGGGDHSKDRIVPDLIRAFKLGTPAVLRNPNAIRPWQHVLDPLMGYVTLVSRILRKDEVGESFNFGPNEDSKLTVRELAEYACKEWGNTASWSIQDNHDSLPEANLLWLDSNRAKSELLWSPKLNARNAISWTIEWEKETLTSSVVIAIDNQITKYMELSA